MSRNSEDFQTKWRPLVELSEHISNTIFRMKATVPALPSSLFLYMHESSLLTYLQKRTLDFPKFSFREYKKKIFCVLPATGLYHLIVHNNNRRLTGDMQQARSLLGTWREHTVLSGRTQITIIRG